MNMLERWVEKIKNGWRKLMTPPVDYDMLNKEQLGRLEHEYNHYLSENLNYNRSDMGKAFQNLNDNRAEENKEPQKLQAKTERFYEDYRDSELVHAGRNVRITGAVNCTVSQRYANGKNTVVLARAAEGGRTVRVMPHTANKLRARFAQQNINNHKR